MKLSIGRKIAVVTVTIAVFIILSVQVTTKQAINYRVSVYRIPLYIKIIEFIDRDYHYRRLVSEVVIRSASDEEKVKELYTWCVRNLAHKPAELNVVDDHPLNIVIRGYGAEDQLEDIFTILCGYAGVSAFYKRLTLGDGRRFYLSFVNTEGQWRPLSVWSGKMIYKGNGKLASIDDVTKDPGLLVPYESILSGLDAAEISNLIKGVSFNTAGMRFRKQRPFGRINMWVSRLFN